MSVDRFREGPPERVRRIDAQDLHFLGVERKLLEREDQVALFGVALDIRVELGGEESAINHVALELGHVDAVGGETAKRLVNRRLYVTHPKQEGCYHLPV